MHLAIEMHVFERLAAISLQRTAIIMKRYTADSRNQRISNLRRNLARNERVLAILSPAGDDVIAFVDLVEQPRDVRRIVLHVRVHRNEDAPARRMNARSHRRRLTIVSSQSDYSHARILRSNLPKDI